MIGHNESLSSPYHHEDVAGLAHADAPRLQPGRHDTLPQAAPSRLGRLLKLPDSRRWRTASGESGWWAPASWARGSPSRRPRPASTSPCYEPEQAPLRPLARGAGGVGGTRGVAREADRRGRRGADRPGRLHRPVRGPRRRRRGDRGGGRGPSGQGQAVRAARRGAARRAVPGLQHVVDPDRRAGGLDAAPRARARAALLLAGAGDEAGRGGGRRSIPPTTTVDAAEAFATTIGKRPIRTKDRSRLHRQHAAGPVPDGGGADVRGRLRLPRGHRRGHAARLRAPDGPADPVRLHRPRRALRRLRLAVRGVQAPRVRAAAAAQADGRLRPPRPQGRPRVLRLLVLGAAQWPRRR